MKCTHANELITSLATNHRYQTATTVHATMSVPARLLLLALLAIIAQVAVATPPACVLAAVNTQPDPSNLKAVCSGDNATTVEQYICKNCKDNTDAALSAYADVCESTGVKMGMCAS